MGKVVSKMVMGTVHICAAATKAKQAQCLIDQRRRKRQLSVQYGFHIATGRRDTRVFGQRWNLLQGLRVFFYPENRFALPTNLQIRAALGIGKTFPLASPQNECRILFLLEVFLQTQQIRRVGHAGTMYGVILEGVKQLDDSVYAGSHTELLSQGQHLAQTWMEGVHRQVTETLKMQKGVGLVAIFRAGRQF